MAGRDSYHATRPEAWAVRSRVESAAFGRRAEDKLRSTAGAPAMSTPIAVGAQAPDFQLPAQSGEAVSLKQLLEKGPVVVYFYPKDETPGCTAEACAFRDSFDVFQKAGASVVGISDDSVESHQKFATHHGLPFLLLSDVGGAVRKAYGVPRAALGLIPGRMTFVVDRQGVVRHSFNALLAATKHVKEAVGVVEKLAQA
jgi:peroxiredoxin Q/BCP